MKPVFEKRDARLYNEFVLNPAKERHKSELRRRPYMKNTQNEKISQINISTLVVGIDVAKCFS